MGHGRNINVKNINEKFPRLPPPHGTGSPLRWVRAGGWGWGVESKRRAVEMHACVEPLGTSPLAQSGCCYTASHHAQRVMQRSLLPRTCPLNCMSPPSNSCQLRTTMRHLNMAVDQLGQARHTLQTTRRPLPLMICLFPRLARHPLGPLAAAGRRGGGGATDDTCASLSVQARFFVQPCYDETTVRESPENCSRSKLWTLFHDFRGKPDLMIYQCKQCTFTCRICQLQRCAEHYM